MAFSSDLAMLVSDQLSRFVTLNRHQLAGQVANLDFWLAQARHALDVIDGYGVRFVRLQATQEQYVATHGNEQVSSEGSNRAASSPHRVPDRELRKARQSLLEATSRFLTRCRKEGMISESVLSKACEKMGIKVDSVRW